MDEGDGESKNEKNNNGMSEEDRKLIHEVSQVVFSDFLNTNDSLVESSFKRFNHSLLL